MLKKRIKIIFITSLVVMISTFTSLTQQVPPPKGIPKRTEDVNAGIVIPSWDGTPELGSGLRYQNWGQACVIALQN